MNYEYLQYQHVEKKLLFKYYYVFTCIIYKEKHEKWTVKHALIETQAENKIHENKSATMAVLHQKVRRHGTDEQ
jgi:hypothetical protein